MVAHACHLRKKDQTVRASLGKGSGKTLSQKQNENRRAERIARGRALPSTCKVLDLIPSTGEKTCLNYL
jgi:hypothetical protein